MKLVRMGSQQSVGNAQGELYDLSKELSEETNLAETNPERLAELVAVWEKLNSEMSESLWVR